MVTTAGGRVKRVSEDNKWIVVPSNTKKMNKLKENLLHNSSTLEEIKVGNLIVYRDCGSNSYFNKKNSCWNSRYNCPSPYNYQ